MLCAGALASLSALSLAHAGAPDAPLHRFAQQNAMVAQVDPATAQTRAAGQPGVTHQASCGTSCDHSEGLPFFDIRLSDPFLKAAAEARVMAANERLAQAKALAQQAQPGGVGNAPLGDGAAFTSDVLEMAALLRTIPGTAIDFHEFNATPNFVRSTEALMTAPRRDVDAIAVVADFLADHTGMFRLDPGELAANRVVRDFVSDHNGVRHITVQQQVDGVDIFGCELRANVTKNNQLVNISSTMLPRPAEGFASVDPVLSPADAVRAAIASVGITQGEWEPVAQQTSERPSQRTTWNNPVELRADEPVVTERVYFPMPTGEIRPAYSVVVPVRGTGHTYDLLVDATDGTVLHRTNRLVCSTPISFRVYTSDSPAPGSPGTSTPSGVQFPVVSRSLLTVNLSDVQDASPQHWIPTGGTETLGNNVDAHLDVNNDNVADLPRPNGTASRTFDFPLDLALAPSGYRDAAVTQMFYLSNLFHDRLYRLGFNEAASNFQTNNFGNGGTGNDAVQADVQDGGGTNNANFSTSGVDGSSARVQMYIWTGPNPDRDGAFDADIVFHELAHGLSIRLHGGLSGAQPQGMGEGWSDYFGVTLNAQPTDDFNAVFPMSGYATLNLFATTWTTNYYFGIRQYPYTTDTTKNALTFNDIDGAQFDVPASVPRNGSGTPSGVHYTGTVWNTMLMEGRAAIWNTQGFAANTIHQQLVVDGMKLSPGNPNFVQSRDAIMQAELINNGNANRTALWTAWAKRGLGFNATSPASSTVSGVVQDFSVPIFVTWSYPDGLPTRLNPNQATTFRVNAAGTGLTLTPNSATLNYRVNGGSFTGVPLTQVNPGQFLATIPAQPCFNNVDYYVSIQTSAGQRNDPASAPTTFNASSVFTDTSVLIDDTFETDTGWTVPTTTATTGAWVRGNPNGTTAQPEDDRTPGTGVNCWFTGQGTAGSTNAGEADIDNGLTTLLSPVYNLAGSANATVSYWRWYSNGLGGAPNADTFRVDVSTDNGATWVNAETNGPGDSPDTRPGWRFASWTLASKGLTPPAQVRVRFVAEDAGTGSLIEAGVDDFQISRLNCTPPAVGCGPADIADNASNPGPDNAVDNGDFSLFISQFFNAANQAACTGATVPCAAADIGDNASNPSPDGFLDNGDFSLFISSFFAPPACS
jgi:hypothetical protein